VTCSGGADQKFTFTERAVIQLLTFVCGNVGGTGANRSVQYTWTADYAVGPYTVRAKPSSSSTWTVIGTTSGTTLAFASPIGAPFTSGAGTYNVQILNAGGDQVSSDTISVLMTFERVTPPE
jgi:hypothetical protein